MCTVSVRPGLPDRPLQSGIDCCRWPMPAELAAVPPALDVVGGDEPRVSRVRHPLAELRSEARERSVVGGEGLDRHDLLGLGVPQHRQPVRSGVARVLAIGSPCDEPAALGAGPRRDDVGVPEELVRVHHRPGLVVVLDRIDRGDADELLALDLRQRLDRCRVEQRAAARQPGRRASLRGPGGAGPDEPAACAGSWIGSWSGTVVGGVVVMVLRTPDRVSVPRSDSEPVERTHDPQVGVTTSVTEPLPSAVTASPGRAQPWLRGDRPTGLLHRACR